MLTLEVSLVIEKFQLSRMNLLEGCFTFLKIISKYPHLMEFVKNFEVQIIVKTLLVCKRPTQCKALSE